MMDTDLRNKKKLQIRDTEKLLCVVSILLKTWTIVIMIGTHHILQLWFTPDLLQIKGAWGWNSNACLQIKNESL